MKAAVCLRMGKWPYELADVPEDSYLFIAQALKPELEEAAKLKERLENV